MFKNLKNQLLQGDCLELMQSIAPNCIDFILCDLPYGTTQNKWDSVIPLNLLWQQYERIIKTNGVIALTAQTPFDKILGASNLKLLKYEWIWNKEVGTGFLNSKKMPLKAHENILIFYKKAPTYNPQMTEAKPENIRPLGVSKQTSKNYGHVNEVKPDLNYNPLKRFPISIINYSKNLSELNSINRSHPTQKPVPLFEYLIKTYTNPGDLVLDNCAGSMTTAIACLNTERKYICMEKDPEYFLKGSERVEKHKNQNNV